MSGDAGLLALHRLVWTALLAALVAIGAYLHLPLGPVPFSLQPFFVLMAGFILGPGGGALALALYLGAGILGLPVFTGGGAGLAHLLGPSGGFLLGFLPMAWLAGLANRPGGAASLSWPRGLAWGLAGILVMYLLGVVRLQMVLGLPWGKAWAVGFLPFIPGDLVKLALAVAVGRHLQKRRLLPR